MHIFSRATAALLVFGSLFLGPAALSPAVADGADPVVTVLTPVSTVPDTSATVDGPFDMVVQVTGGVLQDLTLTPQLPSWWVSTPSTPPITIPAGSCPDSCLASWRIDPAAETAPWYAGTAHLGVVASMGDRSVQSYGNGVTYAPRVTPSWVADLAATPTANTFGSSPAVFDTGGVVVFAGEHGRSPGEQVRVTVRPVDGDASTVPLVSTTAVWAQDPATGHADGRVEIDTSTLPEGRYRVWAQAHDADGRWSFATPAGIVVVHSPPVVVLEDGPGIVAAGQPAAVTVKVRGLRSPDRRPGTVRLTVGGTEHILPAGTADWFVPYDGAEPSSRSLDFPTAGLPVGPASVEVEVLDTKGVTMGSASAVVDIVDFKDVVTVPTLVVGRSASVRLQATAPSGTSLLQCFVYLQAPLDQDYMYNLCRGPRATTVDRAAVFVPQNAGTGLLHTEIMANDGVVGPQRDLPVTVYANRTTALSAPAQAAWGILQTATVSVRDEKRVGVVSAAPGVAVTLQRKNAGTTTWTTIGTATTAANGVAVIRYTNASSGRLRAVVKGTAPGSTVTSPERATTSVAVVSLSSLPTSARAGALVTGAVYAKPYERGATVRFQARRLGTSAWTTYGSGAVASSGYAKAAGRLWSKGTWEVRIQRVASATQAAGYSPVRRVTIG
ncbi:hypothetical protein [Terrabacter sp. 2RAF25]|uniref:hypothetical protein n=1 Tax=Terrabacter sp. 2RAF25 TaxID=3232998 RepID=UPI003F9694F1